MMTVEIHKSVRDGGSNLPIMASGLGVRRPLKQRTGIIHALDVEELPKAVKIAKEVSPYVDAIKISWPLVLEYGGAGMEAIRNATSLPLIACFKVADIPDISKRIVKHAIMHGADGITLHGFVGSDSMQAAIDTAHQFQAYTFMVVEMSHPGAEEYFTGMADIGSNIAAMARKLGSDGIVAPATRPERTRTYREIVGPKMMIMSPGVGAQGGRVGDAIKAGANFEVIGHRIYQSDNPALEAKRFSEAIAQVKKGLAPIQR